MQSIIIAFLLYAAVASAESDVLVKLTNGHVQGTRRDHYLAFEGIPYAKAPVGELRFEPPQPYTEEWGGVWDARQPGAACLQWDHLEHSTNKLLGDEDCLFVNVYTPGLNASVRYPVVVHIHGGAFMFGSGAFWNPDHFSRRNFVFVTLNYRLGPLGFLSTENSVVPGNMGLKDQVMALKWVQQNIHGFGGDPEMVTLSGFSAGGASTHLHLMSDMSKGLFHRAIAHSGSALNAWAQADEMFGKTKRIAVEVGCTSSLNEHDIIECLKQKPASDIVNPVSRFQNFLYNPFSPFGPVVEGDHDGSFLVDKPINLLKQKRVHNIPVILSATEMEGLYPAAEFYNELTINGINEKWNSYVPAILDYETTVEKSERNTVSERIRNHYLGTSALTKETFHKFSKVSFYITNGRYPF
jgi:carboxylesterase type B